MRKVIAVRVNYSQLVGLGHLYRMLRFVKTLSKKYRIIFFIDKKKDLIVKKFNYEFIEVYEGNNKFKSEIEDAKKIKRLIKKLKINYFIIDDYRIGIKWEKFFYQKQKLIIFDDLNNRKHLCDFIIDSKHTGEETKKRYEHLVPKNCQKLLGPIYSIINSDLEKKQKTKKNLLLYFGGGGDLSKYYNFFKYLVKANKLKKSKNKINITLVIGPLAEKFKKFLQFKKNKNVKILNNVINLKHVLEDTSMYFGVSSSIIYELNFLKIPACVFSKNDNQTNQTSNLEQLGIYFQIREKDLISDYKKTSNLIFTFFNNFKKVSDITNYRKIKIDKKACKRIENIIFKSNNNYKKNYTKNYTNNKIQKNGFYKINDSLINKYLFFRNQKINRLVSINKKKIENIDHYLWWFMTQRISFYYVKNYKIKLIFSQEIIKIFKKYFWYGAWFKCEGIVNFSEIIDGLNSQIKKTQKIKNLKWFAIIKKNNPSVFYINKLIGFKEEKFFLKSNINSIIKNFNIKKIKNYYFLTK